MFHVYIIVVRGIVLNKSGPLSAIYTISISDNIHRTLSLSIPLSSRRAKYVRAERENAAVE